MVLIDVILLNEKVNLALFSFEVSSPPEHKIAILLIKYPYLKSIVFFVIGFA